MIEYVFPTGLSLKTNITIQDKTDESGLNVDLWITMTRFYSATPNMPWAYTIDGVYSGWQSFNLQGTWDPQHIATLYVGYARSFTFHLGDTGNAYVGGPEDFAIQLFKGSEAKTVSIKVGDIYKRANPFVNVNGVWKPVVPMIMSGGSWKSIL